MEKQGRVSNLDFSGKEMAYRPLLSHIFMMPIMRSVVGSLDHLVELA